MRKNIPILAIITLFSCSNLAVADENKYTLQYSQQYVDCMAQSQDIKFAVQTCINDELEQQDARLNKAYRKIMSRLSEQRKRSLKEVQRMWIKYRDKNCDFYYDGYSMHTLVTLSCLMAETAYRATELEKINSMYDSKFYSD